MLVLDNSMPKTRQSSIPNPITKERHLNVGRSYTYNPLKNYKNSSPIQYPIRGLPDFLSPLL